MENDQPNELVILNHNARCSFCGFQVNNSLIYGPLYKLGKIKAHYYCVLLSNRLIQNGNDNEGILGFLLSDIQKELDRTSGITCSYCKKTKATIKCAARKCRRSFHLPCGLKGGSLHQFADQYKSFCHVHKPVQNIPPKILSEALKTVVICCICYENVSVKDRMNSLWAPCCRKTWYHRLCLQKLALSAGYFFRCAACNNVQKFSKWMQRFGIFIPQQDASWELVPNAFEELLYRHNTCDAELCKCSDGRQKNVERTIWEIILCESCGSQGIHVACGNLKFLDPEWECPNCKKITQNMSKDSNSENLKPHEGSSKISKLEVSFKKRRRRNSEDLRNSILDKRKKCKTCVEAHEGDEDDVEIDVETVEEKPHNQNERVDVEKDILKINGESSDKNELQEVMAVLKPGPLSYKLSVIQKIKKVSTKKTSTSLEIIELSDSDNDDGEDENSERKKKSKEKDVRVEIINGDDVEETSNKFKFSFTLDSHKWKVIDNDDDDICIISETSKTNVETQKNQPNFRSRSAKSKNTHEEVILEDCENLREKDSTSTPDDDVVILSD